MKVLWKFFRFLCYVLAGVVGLYLLLIVLTFFHPLMVLFFGWILFPLRTLPRVTVDWLACTQAVVCAVLLALVAHGVFGWLYRQVRKKLGDEHPRWRFRWTAGVLVAVVLLFVAGMAMTALVHEIGWLLAADEPWMEFGIRAAGRRAISSNNLKQIGISMHTYHDEYQVLPPGGTFDRLGRPQHGWVAFLLPFIEYGSLKVDFRVPWDHANNRQTMQTEIPALLNPAVQPYETTDRQGYALSHYAANARVVGGRSPMHFDQIADGTSNTILAGEIAEGFRPWGHPLNFRDPAAGLNTPGGFGGPHPGQVTQVLMADGSVRTLAPEIDPGTLRALATPAGGESLPTDWP